jgi:hypothetical protein
LRKVLNAGGQFTRAPSSAAAESVVGHLAQLRVDRFIRLRRSAGACSLRLSAESELGTEFCDRSGDFGALGRRLCPRSDFDPLNGDESLCALAEVHGCLF